MNSSVKRFSSLRPQMSHMILAFGMSIVLTGCKSLSKIANSNIEAQAITTDNYQKLNGTYSNSHDTIFGSIEYSTYYGINDYRRITILEQLFYNYPESAWRDENEQIINPNEKWIKIDFQSKKRAIISMYQNDKFLFSKIIHGKIKNGYFYLRPKSYVLPFVPLLFGYNFERARLGITGENNLIIDYSVNQWGVFFITGGYEKGSATSIFKRKGN